MLYPVAILDQGPGTTICLFSPIRARASVRSSAGLSSMIIKEERGKDLPRERVENWAWTANKYLLRRKKFQFDKTKSSNNYYFASLHPSHIYDVLTK